MFGPTNAPAYIRLTASAYFVNLNGVFVDDFISATDTTNRANLTNFSREMLHGINSIFPPLEVSVHQVEEPISQKILKQVEVIWETTKEFLGWLVDG